MLVHVGGEIDWPFINSMPALQGHPEATIPAIQNKLIPMMLANFAVWPIAHLINFKFIPSQQRILYINCIQVGPLSNVYNIGCVISQSIFACLLVRRHSTALAGQVDSHNSPPKH